MKRPHHLLILTLLVGCRPGHGKEPHDMGAAQHESAAEREAGLAREHDAAAAASRSEMNAGCSTTIDFCWPFDARAEHTRAAEQARTRAAQHRAASAALREAESRSCVGIGERDRSTSPFAHLDDIRDVRPIAQEFPRGDDTVPSRPSGAEIVFAAVPGMTAEWLQRLVDCHIARNAAIGHARASEDMPLCPLTLAGVRASVSSVSGGFAVAVTSEHDATVQEIVRRAQTMEPARVGVSPARR